MKELNALILEGIPHLSTIDSHGFIKQRKFQPGHYKTRPNHVLKKDSTIHTYVDPLQVPAHMDELFLWINSQLFKRENETELYLHPAVIASIAHYNFVRIHPFHDGNGRGARLLMNLILLRKVKIPAVIKRETRDKYISALHKADTGDIAPFITLVMNALLETEEMILLELKTHKFL